MNVNNPVKKSLSEKACVVSKTNDTTDRHSSGSNGQGNGDAQRHCAGSNRSGNGGVQRHRPYDLNNYIDGIKKKLQDLQEEEYKRHNKPIEIPPETSLLLKNRKNVESPKEYQKIIQKQKQMEYRKKGFLNPFASSNTPDHLLNGQGDDSSSSSNLRLGSGVNLLEDLNLACYQRPWGKLEHELKINRAMHFVQREIEEKKLTPEQSRQLRILLVGAINKRVITKKAEVNFNETTGELVEIYRLRYEPKIKRYYLQDYDDPHEVFVPPEKGENGYISHVSELSADQVSEIHTITKGETGCAPPMSPKQKPAIKTKPKVKSFEN